ncbi:MAG: cbb3-type cytochrome c oxidase N-terminal domain-containing protein [Verrucomicrobiota bacterium]
MKDRRDEEAEEPKLRDHVYDGIQEYDQKLPNWWLWTLYLSMIWFVVHWEIYYLAGAGRTDGERIEAQMAAINEVKAAELEKLMAEINDDIFWEMSRNSQITDRGKAAYKTTCSACHGQDLKATLGSARLPGLPLDDDEWKYGGTPMEVFKIVRAGSPDKTKGMVAWEPTLGTKKVAEIVAFVLSHHDPPPKP